MAATSQPLIIYTVLVGDYDVLDEAPAEEGVTCLLFSDKAGPARIKGWRTRLLPNPEGLSARRLSRLPKLLPHKYLPPHAVSLYVDANLQFRSSIKKLASACAKVASISIHPHPNTDCLYEEAEKCIAGGLDAEAVIRSQMEKYRRAGFPANFGLTENNFIIRRNTPRIRRLNELWHREYAAESQRDQLSLMYCLWRRKINVHFIRQNSRKNNYFQVRDHTGDRRTVDIVRAEARLTASPTEKLIELIPAASRVLAIAAAPQGNLVGGLTNRSRDVTVIFPDDGLAAAYSNGTNGYAQMSASDAVERIGERSVDHIHFASPPDAQFLACNLERWLPKLRDRGSVSGTDYSYARDGFVQCIKKRIGKPDSIFPDATWFARGKYPRFGIVTYCSLGYKDALEFSIDSWLENGRAGEVVVFTDNPELEGCVRKRGRVKFIKAFSRISEEPEIAWSRKIDVIRRYASEATVGYFAYLDCDCWVKAPFPEVFHNMGEADVAGTRLLGRRASAGGEANAGVIFFKNSPKLADFFPLWRARMKIYEKQGNRLCEQTALSHLLVEAFDGLHPFKATLVSECLYNSEHDSLDNWLEAVARYQPIILHFKAQRFRDELTKQKVFRRLRSLNIHQRS